MKTLTEMFSDSHLYPAGIELYGSDEQVRRVHLLESGYVGLMWCDDDGKDAYLGLRKAGSLLGAASVICKERWPFPARTLTACRLRSCGATEFLTSIQEGDQFTREVLEVQSREMLQRMRTLELSIGMNARKRLEQFLWDISEDAIPAAGRAIKFRLPIKHLELAGLIGVTPQHLEVVLAKVEADGKLKRDKGWFIFQDRERLWH
jgi:CRP-like cAMP-binding protein